MDAEKRGAACVERLTTRKDSHSQGGAMTGLLRPHMWLLGLATIIVREGAANGSPSAYESAPKTAPLDALDPRERLAKRTLREAAEVVSEASAAPARAAASLEVPHSDLNPLVEVANLPDNAFYVPNPGSQESEEKEDRMLSANETIVVTTTTTTTTTTPYSIYNTMTTTTTRGERVQEVYATPIDYFQVLVTTTTPPPTTTTTVAPRIVIVPIIETMPPLPVVEPRSVNITAVMEARAARTINGSNMLHTMAPPTSANELMDQMALEAARTTTTTTPPPYLIKLRLEVKLSLPEQVQLSQATSLWSNDPGFVDSWQQGLCWTIKADIRARFLRCLNVQLLRIAESVGFEGRRTLRVLADVVGGMLVPRQPELTLSAGAAPAPSSKNPSSEDATDSEQERSLQALGATTTAPGRKMASVFLEYQVGIQSPAEANSVFVAAKEMPKDTLSGNLNLFVMRAQAADDLSASTRFILPIVSTVTEVVQGNSTSGGSIERIEGQEVLATNAAGGTGGGCVAAGLTMIVLLSGVWGLPW